MRRYPNVVVKPDFFFFLSLILLTVPIKLAISWFLAALVHEVGHISALWLLKVPVRRVRIGSLGIKIETGGSRPVTQLLCAAAGPLFGCSLLFFARTFPVLALCAWVQTLFNLLPIRGFDGGRILACLFLLIFPPKVGEKLCAITEGLCLVIIALIAFYLWWQLRAGVIWLFLPVVMILRFVKIPCKPGKQIVQ